MIPELWKTEAEIPEEFQALKETGLIAGSDEKGWRPQFVPLATHKKTLDKGMELKSGLESRLAEAEAKAARTAELEAQVQEFQMKLEATPELEEKVAAHLEKVTADVELGGLKFRVDKKAVPALRQAFEEQSKVAQAAKEGQEKAMKRLGDQLKTGAVTSAAADLGKRFQLRNSTEAQMAVFVERYGDVRPVGESERLEVVFPDPGNPEEVLINPRTLEPYTAVELMDTLITTGHERFGNVAYADSWTATPTPAPRSAKPGRRPQSQEKSIADILREREGRK